MVRDVDRLGTAGDRLRATLIQASTHRDRIGEGAVAKQRRRFGENRQRARRAAGQLHGGVGACDVRDGHCQ